MLFGIMNRLDYQHSLFTVKVYKTMYNFPLFIKEIRSIDYITFAGYFEYYSDNGLTEEEKENVLEISEYQVLFNPYDRI